MKERNGKIIDLNKIIKESDAFGAFLLKIATENANRPAVEIILSATPELASRVYDHGWTLLHIAVLVGNIEIFQMLFQAEPGLVDLPDNSGKTPLDLAYEYGREEIADLIMQKKIEAISGCWTDLEACAEEEIDISEWVEI